MLSELLYLFVLFLFNLFLFFLDLLFLAIQLFKLFFVLVTDDDQSCNLLLEFLTCSLVLSGHIGNDRLGPLLVFLGYGL